MRRFILVLGFLALVPCAACESDGSDAYVPTPYAQDSKPFGLTLAQWSAKWWQWALSIPGATNPINGGDCAIGQGGGVWFLAGHGGDKSGVPQTRACTIPAGKALFFPILNSVCSACPEVYGSAECGYATAEGAVGCVQGMLDPPAPAMTATMDGTALTGLADLGAYSGAFTFAYTGTGPSWMYSADKSFECAAAWAAGNECGAVVGPKQWASMGWWVMLDPPPAGTHVLHFTGVVGEGDSAFKLDMTYNLTVE